MVIRRAALAGLIAVALLSGCASTDSDSPEGEAVAPSPSSSASLPEDPPTASPSGGSQVEISGTVVEGVEAGCRLIDKYLLLPGSGINRDDLTIGANLTVRGRVQQGMMTTCQQGTPFVVEEIVSR